MLLALSVLLMVGAAPVPSIAQDKPVVFNAGEFISRRPPGRWRTIEATSEENLTEDQKAELERLRSIGYLTGSVEAPDRSGVTIYDRDRTWNGLNFYTSGHEPCAILMDMEGNVLHEWTCAFLKAWPEMAGEALNENSQYWRFAHLFDNGDVIAVFEGYGLVKLDKDSNVLWTLMTGEHHDVAVTADGKIYALAREATTSTVLRPGAPILEDYVVVLDWDGNELASISVLDAFIRSDFAHALDDLQIYGDIFHVNSISVLKDGMVEGLPQFADGSVLLSMRTPSMLVVMDMDLMEITWVAKGAWVGQHDPCVLPGGDILLFDNEGYEGRSRLIEFDPVTGEHVWTYQGDPPDDFFTQTCGSVQRLPNGDTLATESDRGRAIEVTPNGEIVWEYLNPERAGAERQLIATIFEMARLPFDSVSGWLGTEP